MNADLIRVDYDALEQIASRFNRQAQEINQMLQAVRQGKTQLEGGGWAGRGADSFFAEMDAEVLPAVERLQQALDEAGATTNRISQIWQQSDEEAAGPLKSGGDGGGAAGQVWGGAGAPGEGNQGFWPGGAPGNFGGGAGGLGSGFSGGATGGELAGDYSIPQDWLSGVTETLGGGSAVGGGNYSVPDDWLSGVTEGLGGEGGGLGAGAGSEAGIGSGAGAGVGGAAGGAPAGAETEPTEETPTPSVGGSGGGSQPETSIRDPYGSGGRGFQRVEAAAPAPGTSSSGSGFRFQSLGGGGVGSSGGEAPPAGGAPVARPAATGGGTTPATSGGSSLPFGLAAASPFVALLGKAVKGKIDDD